MDRIKEIIQSQKDFFTEVRHHLHQKPELSGNEYETATYIRSFLDAWHIPYETAGQTSTVALIEGTEKGRTLALRGDIDALPISEETGLPWASENPAVMHACGHDVHTTFMLAAAKCLQENREHLHGRVKIIFQEAEEIGQGAKNIMAAGLLNDVDSIVALHITQEVDMGVFSLGYETMSSFGAGGRVTIEAAGRDNPILAAGSYIFLVTSLASQRLPKSEQIVLVPTVVKTEKTAGGEAAKVTLSYNSRTLNFANEEAMQSILQTAAEKTAQTFNCKINLELRTPGNVVNNDRHFTDLAASVIREHFGPEALLFSRPVMSGEDFALYQKTIPGVFIHIGGAEDGIYRALHTSKTYVDDRILPIGIEFLLRYVHAFFAEK